MSRFSRVWAAIKDALSLPIYHRDRLDRGLGTTLSTITGGQITGALSTLSSTGRAKDLAEIYDLLCATDPHIRGVVRQLKAGCQAAPWGFTPADETPQAQAIVDQTEKDLNGPSFSIASLIPAIIECELRGCGLIEILWNDVDTARRVPVGFSLVPQQRIILDINTGEIGINENPMDPTKATPISTFPAGKFIVVQADVHVPDFSRRGVYRTILSEWFNRINVAGWEMQGLERYGLPIPVAYYSTENDRQVANDALESFGAAGSLLVSSQSKIEFQSASTATNGSIPHETYLEKSAQRISVALVGSEQTATVGTDQGSRASAGVHAMVRGDVLAAHWQTISDVLRKYLISPYVSLNWGAQNAALAPIITPQLDSAPDRAAIAAWLRGLTELGLKIGENYVRDETGVPAPAPGEQVLSLPSAAPADPFGAFGASRHRASAEDPSDPELPLSGAPITEHLDRLISGLGSTADLAALPIRLARSKPDTKALVDQLAALQLDAWARGAEAVKRSRQREVQ